MTAIDRDELRPALELAAREALAYLERLDEEPVRGSRVDDLEASFAGPLPEEGEGAVAALAELARDGLDGAVHSAGPRFFHFVTGGGTPAALGADWLTATIDQMAGLWVAAPVAAELERVSLDWLKDLFGLPGAWGGVLTTGATAANLVGLAAARQWWGERHGRDVAAEGLAGLPAVPVFSSGRIHPSSRKALAVLGLGRESPVTPVRDAAGSLDASALEEALRRLGGAPAVLVANAGDVNTAAFDPVAGMAELAERYGVWLHVDGAFGLFARLTPRAAHLADGVERADSVTADGHKWLNVPYDCGFAFVRDPSALAAVFSLEADYLPSPGEQRLNYGYLGPESSRRGRSLAVWATLRAYGRSGYRAMVERHLDLAQRVARVVDEAPDLERLADVPLNIVCFRFRPPGIPEEELDELNARLGEEVLADGRVYVGTTLYEGKVAFRPAIVNWRTQEADVDLLVAVVRELGAALLTRTN